MRDKALWHLYGNIWHQGTVYEAAAPTIPFLIRLAACSTQGDRPAIIQYLGALATGHSWHDVHSRGDFWGLKSQPGFQKKLARELSWVRNAHEAVAAGVPRYMQWLADKDPAVRVATPYLLAVLPERAAETLPAIRERLAAETDHDARASLVQSLGVLGCGAADPELRFALGDADPLVRVAAAVALARHRSAELQVRDILLQAWMQPEPIIERWNRLPWCSEGAEGDLELCFALLETDAEPILDALIAAVEASWDYPPLATAGSMLRLAFKDRPAQAVAFAELSATQQRVVRVLAERICRRYDNERRILVNMNDEFEALGLPGDPQKLREYVGLARAVSEPETDDAAAPAAVIDSAALTCDRCGYGLRGCTQSRCPECGEAFNPRERSEEARERRRRILRRATPWPTWCLVLSFIVFGETFALRSNPGNPWYYSIGLGGVVVLRLALFLAIVLLCIDWIRRRLAGRRAIREGWRTPAHLGRRRRWAVLPLLMLLWVSSWWWNWMLLARFHFARPSLEAAAKAALKHEPLPIGQTVGTYRIYEGYVNSFQGMDGQPWSIVSFETGCQAEIEKKEGYEGGRGFDYRPNDPWPDSENRIAPCWYVVD